MSFWKRLLEHTGLGETPGAAMRRQHSAFLTEALTPGNPKQYPRIPVRPVDQGGFEHLRARTFGSQHAERWWQLALDRVER